MKLLIPILSSKYDKNTLNFRIVNADRVAVIDQEPTGLLDYYRYRIGIIPCFLLISVCCFAQETEKRGTIKIEKSNCVRLDNKDSIYAFVDQMPEFRGGQDSLMAWLGKNVIYPKIAVEENSKATVFASFVVLKDGSISDIKIFKANNNPFEKEALRLLDMMPDWIPGRCNGTLADVKINLPIKFGLK